MRDLDPHLPQRLADSTAVRFGERRVMAAARRAYATLAGEIKARLETSGYRPVEWLTWPGWQAAIEGEVLPRIGEVYARAYDEQVSLTAAASMDARANADTYLRALRNPLVRASDAVWKGVKAEIRKGVAQSRPTADIAIEVDRVLAEMGADRWHDRAIAIARTEVVAALNNGRMGAGRALAREVGIPERYVYKRWLATTTDDRTRHTHREADGQVVTLNTKFTVGGSRCAAPGDPTLPPAERVQCRCTLVILLPGDKGNPNPSSLIAAAVEAGFDPNQKRVPKGNGRLSGRFLDSPSSILDGLKDLLGDSLDGVDTESDLPAVSKTLRDLAAAEPDAGKKKRLAEGADGIDDWKSVNWAAEKKGPVKPGEMTLGDVPPDMAFPQHDRTKPGMHALTAQDYVDYFNREGKRIPPVWTNVLIADGPYDPQTHENRQQVSGLDSQGREQPQYASGWTDYKSGVKWVRAKALIDANEGIGKAIDRDATLDPAAGALALQYVMGIRTGSDADRKTVKGHQAIGASTMTAESVTLNDDGSVSFDYIGKSNKRAQLTSKDPLVRKTMEHYLQGKSGQDRLFDTDEGKVRDYFAKVQEELGLGKQFTPKDFRTLHGSTIAARMVAETKPKPAKDSASFQARRKEIAEAVSTFLNNTPTVALESYIMPSVFDGLAPALVASAIPGEDGTVPTWDDITAAWKGIAQPPVDLTRFGPLDPAETYDDFDDELGIDDPDEFDDLEASAGMDEETEAHTDVAAEHVPVPWHGVLAPEGVMSGDKRKFAPGSLRNRDLPLPLMYQDATQPGHDGAVRVGNIQGMARVGNEIRAWGVMDTSTNADEAVRQLAGQMLRGVSVDVDDAEMAFETADGEPIDGDSPVEAFGGEEPVMVITSGRIAGSTLVSIPAFQEAFVRLGEPPAEWALDTMAMGLQAADAPPPPVGEEDAPGGSVAAGDFVTWGDKQGKVKTVDGDSATVVVYDGDTPTDTTATVPVADLSPWSGPAPAKDAKDPVPPSAGATHTFVEGHMPGKLKRYWVDGPGAAKVGWGSPGDFERCRAQLGKHVGPEMLSGLCANLHKAATGEWPGHEAANLQGLDVSKGHAITEPVEQALVASAGSLSDYDQPVLDGPTPLTVTADGRVFGHLATWGTCHIGFQGQCITPPSSPSAYAYFTTGEVLTDDGASIPVGHITLGTGHAGTNLNASAALAHYDNTGTVSADVAAGEDAWGIWLAGRVRGSMSAEQVHSLRAAALSGDWRRIGGNMELIAALAVNVPGFPIPRTRAGMKAGRQVALVASGVVSDDRGESPAAPITAAGLIREMRAIDQRRVRATAAAARIRKTRVAAAAARLTKG